MFFTSKLILEHDNWYIRQLHSEAALTMLRHLHLLDMPMVVLADAAMIGKIGPHRRSVALRMR